MNIGQLPNEILVNILGRLHSSHLNRCKLVNQKFHTIIKMHNLQKPVIQILSMKWIQDAAHNHIEFHAKGNSFDGSFEKIVQIPSIDWDQKNTIKKIKAVIQTLGICYVLVLDIDPLYFHNSSIFKDVQLDFRFLHRLCGSIYIEIPSLDDKTLVYYAEEKVTNVFLGHLISPFTLDGIINAVKKMSETNLEVSWNLGVLARKIVGLDELEAAIRSIRKLVSTIPTASLECNRYNYVIKIEQPKQKFKFRLKV